MTAQKPLVKLVSLTLVVALDLCAGGPLVERARRQAFDGSTSLSPTSFDGSSDVTGTIGPASLPLEDSMVGNGQVECLAILLCSYTCSTCRYFDTNCTFACQCPDGSLSWNSECNTTSTQSGNNGKPPDSCQVPCDHGRCSKTSEGYQCDCDPGWTGQLCTDSCTLSCGKGVCAVGSNGEQYCNCPYPWQGVRCSELPLPDSKEADNTWTIWLAGSLTAGFLLMASLFAFVTIYMWRHRYVIIMKVVFYFLPYEDKDGKLFDAFVSYRSCPEDLDFVYGTLTPRLEHDLKFKLCLHERDFLVGETIANNILWAVENSRRTILVLSPSYLESEWTRLEYQKAQHEMLKRKQRIIPIMFRDVSGHMDSMDKTLKAILQSVTYLDHAKAVAASDEHRVDKFWKRLLLSMPKKKDTPDQVLASDYDSPSPSPAPVPSLAFESSPGEVCVGSDGKEGWRRTVYTPSLLGERGGEEGSKKKGGVSLINVRFLRDGKDGWEADSERRRTLEAVAKAHELRLDAVC